MERTDYMKPFVAGCIASLGQIITIFAVTALLAEPGQVSQEITSALGFAFGSSPKGDTSNLWWGQVVLLSSFNVLLLPYLYGFFFIDMLEGSSWKKGLVMGLGLWLFIQCIAMPLVGNGIFSLAMAHPLRQVLLNLVYTMVYGTLLASVTESGENAAKGGSQPSSLPNESPTDESVRIDEPPRKAS